MPLLSWHGRDADLIRAQETRYRLLDPVAALSHGDPDSPNMLIEGDNLDALKALLPYYAGQVKCVFIDPPYNTRSAFEHYDDNLEHSQWLSMMYPRLELLRELLAEDGSVWITIDDNEAHYLKVLMDEFFGRGNFVANVFWQKTHTRENRTDVSAVHDHVLLYAKDREVWKEIRNPLPASDSQLERYSNPDNDPRGNWASLPAHAKAEKGRRQAQFFTVATPSGRKIDPPSGRCWLYTEERFAEMVADNRIWFGATGNNAPRVKKFLSEVREGLVPMTFWPYDEVGTNGQAKSEIVTLFPGTIPFSTPKPEKLLERILHIATNPGDLVLDSFLGSGTTAAVAQKMNRRWIGIEMGEHARTHCQPRLTKVVDGEQGGISATVGWQGGGGFRYYRLGGPVFDVNGQIREDIGFEQLAAHLWFAETGTARPASTPKAAFLGAHGGTGYYLLYGDILGVLTTNGANVLTRRVLRGLPRHDGPKVIYAEACDLPGNCCANKKSRSDRRPTTSGPADMALALKDYQRRALASLEQYFEATRLTGDPAAAFSSKADKGLPGDYRPMPAQPAVPYVCLRIPTGGGKTVMGAHIIQSAGRALLDRDHPLVLWMVPTSQIKTQTLEAFRDPRHPYRQELDDAFGGQVAVLDIAEYPRLRPADLATRVCIVVATVAALRVENQEGRKVYEHHEDLEPHFAGPLAERPGLEQGEDGKALASFANLLKLHGPLVIMDEAHNATTPLSYTVYERLGPKAVVELTATPDTTSSNVLVSVSAFELKAEDMIKFPVVLTEHGGEWREAVSNAVARRKKLAEVAKEEPEYIRPLLLVQAESERGTATVAEVKRHLIDTDGVAEKAIATGDQRELDGIDLFARDCPVEVVITKQALKEGWDCSFAYVFCSVAQVRSTKDVQQLLGRVLRMPYAMRRKQEAMNKAYAHVVSDTFGHAAGELTQSLIDIGFNPMEAANAIRRDRQDSLPLQGGAITPPALPTTRIVVSTAPQLDQLSERDQQRIVFTPGAEGSNGSVEVIDEINPDAIEAIIAAVRGTPRKSEVRQQLQLHQNAVAAAKAPSERGATFQVPRLCRVVHGELEVIDQGARQEEFPWEPLDRGTLPDDFTWDLLGCPPDLASFRFLNESMTFEVDLAGEGTDGQITYRQVKDDTIAYLPGFAKDRSETDLVGWLDQEVRDATVRQSVLREWLRRAVHGLLADRGFSLAQLLKGRFVLRRKLIEQLQIAREQAIEEGFQQALFGGDPDLVATLDEPVLNFSYPADMTRYPARRYYDGSYHFQKHYYPRPGDLDWKTPTGRLTEEFECARAIDLLNAVEYWVRNVVHDTQFWMPTAKQRTYPDFVAKLRDGRLFVVEYKGSDRFSSDQEKEKRMVGELWARRSEGKCLYLMAQKIDAAGRNVREQLLAALE